MKKFVYLFLMALLPLFIHAKVVKIDGIWYNIPGLSTVVSVACDPSPASGSYYGKSYSGDVVIPEEVTYNNSTYKVTGIDDHAFYWCDINSISLPNSIRFIGDYAFLGCRSLKSITIPNKVERIGNAAFNSCESLESVTLPKSVLSIGEYAFALCEGLKSITLSDNLIFIGNQAFTGCSNLTSIAIPSSVKRIEPGAFNYCTSLTSVHITDLEAWLNIDLRGSGANPLNCAHHLFLNGKEITDLTIPSTISKIGFVAFYNCTGIKSVTIPSSVKEINGYAFDGSGLKSVTFMGGETYIYYGAFSNCTDLKDVYCKDEESPGGGTSVFSDTPTGQITLHVPEGSIDKYKENDFWNNFKEIVALPRCATPEICYANGKISFSCDTPDVKFVSEVIMGDAKNYENEINVSKTCTVRVYATKEGLEPSDVAKRDIIIGDPSQTIVVGDVDGDGKVNVADHVRLSDIILNKNK